jgi:indole-3-glycerol phosphate synthase
MDFLDRVVFDVRKSLQQGFYRAKGPWSVGTRCSFVKAIQNCPATRNAIIAEIKPISPTEGDLLNDTRIDELISHYISTNLIGLSVLTEPTHFGGSLEILNQAGRHKIPVLMKDFVLSLEQLDAACAHGASAVLLIARLFYRGYSQQSLDTMIRDAHARGLEVLLEVASHEEYLQALESDAEMIGINNRDLATLQIDLNRTIEILNQWRKDRLVWSLSGMKTKSDLKRLREAGVDAFLIGTGLLKARNPRAKLDELMDTGI